MGGGEYSHPSGGAAPEAPKKSNTGKIILFVVGVVVLLACCCIAALIGVLAVNSGDYSQLGRALEVAAG